MRNIQVDSTQFVLLCALLIVAIPATRLRPFLVLRGQTSVQARRQRLRMALMLGLAPRGQRVQARDLATGRALAPYAAAADGLALTFALEARGMDAAWWQE